MFSCFLVRASDKSESDVQEDVLTAENVDLEVQVISNAGRGTAECRYVVERDSENMVACIPSVIHLKDSSTQQVKVTQCTTEVQKEDHTSVSTSLQLTKLDADYSEHARSMPSYPTIKKLLKRSISPEDMILYLGNFEARATIVLKFEFLLQMKASFSVFREPTLQCTVENSGIPSRHLSYKLKFASNMQIVNVRTTSPSLANFNWSHMDRAKQVIQVGYESHQPADAGNSCSSSSDFCIEMAQGVVAQSPSPSSSSSLSACCSCLVQTASVSSRHVAMISGSEDHKCSNYDGVMMLTSRLTPNQLLPKTSRNVSPSEFVFLVDCSASMNPFINSVIATLITSIKSLPEGCYFNLISFGSSFRQLFPQSKEYSKSSVKNAVDFVNQMKASLGGTEFLPPLKWIFKTARKGEMPCQVFIITDVDQEVKDVPYMLNTIKKHRDMARCHTFGIGSSICESLVTSIADVSGGRSIILKEGDRLQTKVMEVLKESLEPFLMDATIRWAPPRGYTVVDSTPKSLGTVYSHRSRLAFAFLRKTSSVSSHAPPPSAPPATILGRLSGSDEIVEVPIQEAVLPPLTPHQTAELASVLTQVGVWSKLDELEVTRLLAVSRKNSTEEAEADKELSAPSSKRPRLNGEVKNGTTTSSTLNSHAPPSYPPPAEIQLELLHLSLSSKIPCQFTFFKGTMVSVGESESSVRDIVQALPYKQSSVNHHQKAKNGVSQRYQEIMRRRRHNSRHKNGTSSLEAQQSGSIATSLAKSTISAVSSALMNFVSLIHPEATAVREDGKTIDDELEMGKKKGSQLFWDEQRGEIKYPSMYYKQCKSSNGEHDHRNHYHHHHHHHHHHRHSSKHHHNHISKSSLVASGGGARQNSHSSPYPAPLTNGHRTTSTRAQATPYYHHTPLSTNQCAMDTSSSSDDEEDFTISDSESDSSVELDWESLPKTREYLPIIQMQLFSGAWPMIHEFSYAVRVPLGEIGRLPLLQTNHKNDSQVAEKAMPYRSIGTAAKRPLTLPPHRNTTQDLDEDLTAHFWTTALAVTCFRECFPQFESEWDLIVRKGEAWLEQNLDQCALGKEEVHSMARELLFRKM